MNHLTGVGVLPQPDIIRVKQQERTDGHIVGTCFECIEPVFACEKKLTLDNIHFVHEECYDATGGF